MGWRFRKSLRIAPGLRVNISKTGLSYTVGRPGLSVNLGRKGAFANLGLPGTGLSYRQKISQGATNLSGGLPRSSTVGNAYTPPAPPLSPGSGSRRSFLGLITAIGLAWLAATIVTSLKQPDSQVAQRTTAEPVSTVTGTIKQAPLLSADVTQSPQVPTDSGSIADTRSKRPADAANVRSGKPLPYHKANRQAAYIASVYMADPAAGHDQIRGLTRQGKPREAYLVSESLMSEQPAPDPVLRAIADEAFQQIVEAGGP